MAEKLLFTKNHEWILIEGKEAIVGLTEHAINELGEIVYIELPNTGNKYKQEDEFGTIESVKTVSSLYLPLTGTICEVNENAKLEPSLLNESPYDDGWLVRIKDIDSKGLKTLLSSKAYKKLID